jgi:hypothetical protein
VSWAYLEVEMVFLMEWHSVNLRRSDCNLALMMKVFPLIAMYYSLNEEMDLNDLDLHCPYCFYDFSPS